MFANRNRITTSAIGHLNINQNGYGLISTIIYIVLTCWVAYYAWLFLQTGSESENKKRVFENSTISTIKIEQASVSDSTADEEPEILTKNANKTTLEKPSSKKYSPSDLIRLLSKYSYTNSNHPSLHLTAERLSKYINELIAHNNAAIPSIREFLRSGNDLDFTQTNLSKQIGYDSLRLALFDVLYTIGAPEAESVWYEALHDTNNPAEIAALASYLDEYAPDKYRRDIVETALDAFRLVSNNRIDGKDAGPVFQVFQDYGDASLVSELEQVSQLNWGQYASVTLANLPDGAGIPSLMHLSQNAPQSNLYARFALQMLAQSAEHPTAQTALINSALNGQIPDQHWPEFARRIAGLYQVQIVHPNTQDQNLLRASSVRKLVNFTAAGNQTLYGVNYATPNLTIEQMAQRLDLVDRLLAEASTPAARQSLENAYEILWSSYMAEGQ